MIEYWKYREFEITALAKKIDMNRYCVHTTNLYKS